MPFDNAAGRALRRVALGRRARPFARSSLGGERATFMYSLIATAKPNATNPQARLADAPAASRTTRPHAPANSCPGLTS